MLLLMTTLTAFASAPLLPCGTPQQSGHYLSHPVRPPGPPVTDLVLRDSHGDIPNIITSDHFALKWGPDLVLTEEQSSEMIGYLEYAWDNQVQEWEMEDPTGVGGTYFNVYIGDTGGVVPSVYGSAGYFTTDGDGYPMIVLANFLHEDPPYAESVIVHEFFHAVQYRTGSFWVWETGGWFWEATATWAQGELTTHWAYYSFLPFYAVRPDSGLYHHSTESHGGAPPDLHQYGAFIFPRYLSEHLGQGEAILNAWRSGDTEGDPVEILQDLLTEEVFSAALADHAAHNLRWDYADGEGYAAHVGEVATWWPETDHRVTNLQPHEDPEWQTIPSDHVPQACGYNLIPLSSDVLEGDQLTFAVRQDVPDGVSTSVDFRATIVEINGGVPTYHSTDPDQSHTVMTVNPEAELWAAVANVTSLGDIRGTRAYKVRFTPPPEPPPADTGDPQVDTGIPGDTGTNPDTEDEEIAGHTELGSAESGGKPAGCACSATNGNRSTGWLVLLPLIAIRRKASLNK